MTREEIYNVLNTERTYQSLRWGWRQDDGSFKDGAKSVGDFLTYMRHYLSLAEKAAAETSGNHGALDMMRKVAALAVACFEQHDVPERQIGNVLNGHDGKWAN